MTRTSEAGVRRRDAAGGARVPSPAEPPSAAGAAPGAGALPAATRVFDSLRRHEVRYCHWKSNEHLAAGLAGLTDLDLLVDRSQAAAAREIFAAAGYKRFQATPATAYPAIEDYLALDEATGRLSHLHVHYQLVAGQQHLKGYRLPWEEWFLASRSRDPATGVYVADPHLELLALFVRCVTKLRLRDLVGHVLGRRAFRGGIAVEYAWLRPRVSIDRARAVCGELLTPRATPAYAALVRGPVTLLRLLRFRWAARHTLAGFRTHSRLGAVIAALRREWAWLVAGVNRRFLRLARPVRRTVPTGGLFVAILGPDGSGKSTVAAALARQLAGKLDVLLLYFGSGDGPSSLLRWPLWVTLRLLRRIGVVRSRGGGPPARTREPHGEWNRSGWLWTVARWSWALALAAEKRRKLRLAWRARNRGMVVVTDRLPQAQVPGFNDGPLLSRHVHQGNRLVRWLARWEAGPYEWADRHPPDLVIKLTVTPATALARKPESGLADIERRIDAVRRFRYPVPTAVLEVDGDRSRDEVLRAVAHALWTRL